MTGRHSAARAADRRVIESDEYVAGLVRMMHALGRRVGTDPGALAYVPEVEQALRDSINLGYAQAHDGGWSYGELAAITGVTRPAVLKRVRAGYDVRARIEAAAGPLVRLADLRRARAARHAAAGITDTTGGRKERAV